MTRIFLALAAALAFVASPLAAQAQPGAGGAAPPSGAGGAAASRIGASNASSSDRPKDKAADPAKLDQKALDRGMKEAPALQQASGAPCAQVTAAAFRGEGTTKGADGKTGKVAIYETACQGGLGYLIQSPQGGKPQAFDCLAASGSPTHCILPQNADPKQGLAGVVQAAGKTCAVSDAKYLGTSTTSGEGFYEVACGTQAGYRLGVPTSGRPTATECAALMDGPNACTLTTKAQIVASLAPIAQASGKTCQVSDVRWMGQGAKTGDTFYEFGCGQQPGFIAVLDSTGKFKQAVDCAKAQGLGDGCKLTDTTVAQSAEAGTYSKLAAASGFPCDVKQYRFIGTDKDNHEVVELACKNRPDGAIGVFPASGKGEVIDCVRAGMYGQSCKLSDPALAYPKYTAALAAKGRASCKVSGASFLGTTPSGEQFVETACSDGLPGWVIAFNGMGYDAKELLSCQQATAQGVPCKLPTNVAGNKGVPAKR
jgi:hypothetical protein